MPRTNKITARVVPENMGAYKNFLDLDRRTRSHVSDLLRSVKLQYEMMAFTHRDAIDHMSCLEEIIIQIRCKEVINEELRLSLNMNKKKNMSYIYARTLFYRKSKQINDIRVCIGLSEQYGTDLVGLLEDEEFKHICVTRLTEAMDKEIEVNINNLKLVPTNE